MSFGHIVLDPAAVAVNRVELDLNSWETDGGPIAISKIDWGDAAITAFLADQVYGSSVVDFTVPNRTITIDLFLGTGDYPSEADQLAAEEAARAQLQQKVARFQAEGGWLLRQRDGGEPMYCDIVNASLTIPDVWGATGGVEPDVVVTLDCLPDFYGDEITLDSITATGHCNTVLQLAGTNATIQGDYPARTRVVLADTSGQDQLGVMAAVRSRHYDVASTAAAFYEAEALTPVSPAAIATVAGASGGASNNVVEHSSLPSAIWTPVLSTGQLTHVGSYRVWARIFCANFDLPQIRFVWWVGGSAHAQVTVNDIVTLPGVGQFFVVDLGEVRLDAPPSGSYAWEGAIQALVSNQGDNLSIDCLYLQAVDEGASRASVSIDGEQNGSAFQALDQFLQTPTGTALTGLNADVGGAWSGAGDADDFTILTGNILTRLPSGADSATVGRFATIGSARAGTVVQCDIWVAGTSNISWLGVLARYVNTTNWLQGVVLNNGPGPQLLVRKMVAGTPTTLAALNLTADQFAAQGWYTIRLLVDAGGRYWIWYGARDSNLVLSLEGQDVDLATGGTLASGKPGIYDEQQAAVTANHFDNFQVWLPSTDAAIFGSRHAELRTDQNIREEAGGTLYAPMAPPIGDLMRLPPSGLEGRPVELLVKPTRGDFESHPDTALDGFTAQVIYRPCYLSRI